MQKKVVKTVFVLLLLSGLIGCLPQDQVAGKRVQRTYYESLQLQTPETAIQSFIRSFQGCDFASVYMILSPAAQQHIQNSQLSLSIANILGDLSTNDLANLEQEFNIRLPLDNPEHFPDTLHYFDTLMLTAAQNSLLPFELSGEARILGLQTLESALRESLLEVVTRIDGIDEPILFRLVQSPNEKWRIHQIVMPGGQAGNIPWTFPSTPMQKRELCTQIEGAFPREPMGQIDLSLPETTVQEFVQAFQKQDFPTVYWILHYSAQREWLANLSLLQFDRLFATNDPQFVWQTEWAQGLMEMEETGQLSHTDASIALLGSIGSGLGNETSPYLPLVMEQIGNNSYLFDQIMLAADDKYLIDFDKPLTILEKRIDDSGSGPATALVKTILEDSGGFTTFHLQQSPFGQWRILRVVAPGGNEKNLPWAVP